MRGPGFCKGLSICCPGFPLSRELSGEGSAARPNSSRRSYRSPIATSARRGSSARRAKVSATMSQTSRFAEVLHAGRFAVTAEIAPPASTDPQALLDHALPLRGLADAVNVTDGAQARASMSAVAAAAILVKHDIEPILQMNCR